VRRWGKSVRNPENRECSRDREQETGVMPSYEFTLILSGVSEITEALTDAVDDAGCDDGTLDAADGVAFIRFTREAATLQSAIVTAIADLGSVGLTVSRVETTTTEI
jgi:hypothetical protein